MLLIVAIEIIFLNASKVLIVQNCTSVPNQYYSVHFEFLAKSSMTRTNNYVYLYL